MVGPEDDQINCSESDEPIPAGFQNLREAQLARQKENVYVVAGRESDEESCCSESEELFLSNSLSL